MQNEEHIGFWFRSGKAEVLRVTFLFCDCVSLDCAEASLVDLLAMGWGTTSADVAARALSVSCCVTGLVSSHVGTIWAR